ncbi:hypothetical protein FRY74_10275 [Vicingus serpentipes]|uniref:Uncharacterized protein n=1 Tax=Vicingus serpentipes TaxID=1926625 RepID=A0A5C6RRC4_9FLAO|nr:hypothetical protein [Vicingus serpentipes]TXB64828.1 hypothetical protein FRY74_10275 [Vicingus serpentipes]
MSLINKNNYEAFLLDYMEQNLSADMVAELMLFFEQNPDLKHDLEELGEVALPIEDIVFEGKDDLKKEVLENLMIAEIEGLNSVDQSKELQEAIEEDNVTEKAFLLYQKTVLKPTPVIFENKESLKRERKIIPMYWWATSAAAILIAFFLIRNMNTDGVQKTQNNFADNKELEFKKNSSEVEELPKPIEKEFLDNETIQVAKKVNTTPIKVEKKKVKPTIKEEQPIENNLVAEQEPINEKDSITILPTIYEEEVLLAENNIQIEKEVKGEPLSVGQFLKKEAQKKVLKDEQPEPNKKAEIMVVDLLAKVAGKNARVDKTKNDEDETEQYALNIGGFSFSKKVRK